MEKETDEYQGYVPRESREYSLGDYTVVYDRERNRQVMRLRGVVVLPIGAEVELTNPNVDAKVVGVRLLAGSRTGPVHVCLDVSVPKEYWSEE